MPRFSKYLPLIIFLSSFLFVGLFTKTFLTSANEASRIGTIISLGKTGSFKLEQYKEYTWDIIRHREDFYSSKPPVFSWLAFQIKRLIPADFPIDPRQSNAAFYFLTWLTGGLCYSLLLVFFYKSLLLVKINYKLSLFVTMLLGLGTIVLPFATVFTNHLPAALFLYLGFYFYLKDKVQGKNHKLNLFLAGFFVTLSAVTEITIAPFFWLLMLGYLIIKKNESIFYFILGSLPWLALHLFLNWQIVGDILPFYLHKELYPNPVYNPDYNGWGGKLLYFYVLMLSPAKGFIFYNPLVIYGFYAIYQIIKKKLEFFVEAAGLLICFAASSVIWLFFTYDASGSSYGLRWAIPYLPIFFFFLANYLRNFQLTGVRLHIFYYFVIVSIIISLIGLINPWTSPLNFGGREIFFPLYNNLFLLKSHLF